MNEPSHIMHDPTKTPIKPCLLLYPSDIHHIHLTFALDGTSGTNSVVYNSVHCVWQNHSLVTTQAIGSLGRLQKEEDEGECRGSETEANEPQGDYSV